jgi:ribonuclease BN (tRNA processing enzyme)
VLGKSPSWQDVDGACSGYLIEEGDTALLLDCGCGVFSKLRRYRDYASLDAVVISHLHADHFLDLVPYAYALGYSPRLHGSRPRLFAPPGSAETFRRVVGSWGSEELIERAFELAEYDPQDTVAVGSLRVRFRLVPHYVPTFALDVSSTTGAGRVTYGADHRPTEELVELAQGADLLLVEATLAEPEPEGPRGHLTPAEAGEHGARAHAGRLVLTHITDELDQEWAAREATRTFGRPVTVAREGDVFTV